MNIYYVYKQIHVSTDINDFYYHCRFANFDLYCDVKLCYFSYYLVI